MFNKQMKMVDGLIVTMPVRKSASIEEAASNLTEIKNKVLTESVDETEVTNYIMSMADHLILSAYNTSQNINMFLNSREGKNLAELESPEKVTNIEGSKMDYLSENRGIILQMNGTSQTNKSFIYPPYLINLHPSYSYIISKNIQFNNTPHPAGNESIMPTQFEAVITEFMTSYTHRSYDDIMYRLCEVMGINWNTRNKPSIGTEEIFHQLYGNGASAIMDYQEVQFADIDLNLAYERFESIARSVVQLDKSMFETTHNLMTQIKAEQQKTSNPRKFMEWMDQVSWIYEIYNSLVTARLNALEAIYTILNYAITSYTIGE